jgi:uncharacterized YccA/Bax inhibitor family protein
MLQSKNPVLAKAPAFQPQYQGYPEDSSGLRDGYSDGTQTGYGYLPPAGQYGPQTGQYDPQTGQYAEPAGAQPAAVMTLDDVLAKSAITMGLLIAVGAATMVLLPLTLIWPATVVAGLATFGLVFIVSARRKINPGMVFVYSIIEGVFLGAISKVFEYAYPGIVMPAVFGTFVAAGVTLAAYKFLRVRIGGKLRRIVVVSTMALAGVYLVNFLLSIFGVHTGIIEIGSRAGLLAIIFSAVGVVLAVLNLILDFDYIESGIRNQAPASESWRAAFGLVVTMVWLYTELLRILSYFQRN